MSSNSFAFLAELAKRFGSPAYIYDLAEVRSSHAHLRRSLPEHVEIAYSLKANPHPALVRALAELGCALDVSSLGELTTAATAGRPMIFTGPGKSDHELEAAIRAGCILSLESPAELPRLDQIARHLGVGAHTIQVILRINPDAGFGSTGITMAGETQFGFPAASCAAWRSELARTDVNAIGYHVYGGSNLPGASGLVDYFRAALECIAKVNEVVGLDIELLDLGGGFPAPYAAPGALDNLAGLRDSLETLLGTGGATPRIVVESGRFLSATSGTLLATVQDIKHTSSGTRFVVMDAGVNHLGGMSALRRLPPVTAVPVASGADRPPARPTRLVGPLCTPLDVLNLRAQLPEELAVGDVLTIPNVGAYGLTASLLGFLSRELPCEVVVDGDQVLEATRLTLERHACKEN